LWLTQLALFVSAGGLPDRSGFQPIENSTFGLSGFLALWPWCARFCSWFLFLLWSSQAGARCIVPLQRRKRELFPKISTQDMDYEK
jgi:hypothetical protein